MSASLTHTVYICSDFAVCKKHKLGVARSAIIDDLSASMQVAARDYCRFVVSRLCGVPSDCVYFSHSFLCRVPNACRWCFITDSQICSSPISFFFSVVIE